jgi:hypothetical protein
MDESKCGNRTDNKVKAASTVPTNVKPSPRRLFSSHFLFKKRKNQKIKKPKSKKKNLFTVDGTLTVKISDRAAITKTATESKKIFRVTGVTENSSFLLKQSNIRITTAARVKMNAVSPKIRSKKNKQKNRRKNKNSERVIINIRTY